MGTLILDLMNILITGKPGIGKTTLIHTLIEGCRTATGFYTREIREKKGRVGFAIQTLHGETGILAHVDIQTPYHVSRYGVNISDIETLCVPSMDLTGDPIVIDEIGKMELFSPAFREQVIKALDTRKVLASIMERPHPFTDAIKQRKDSKLYVVTEKNRRNLGEELQAHLCRGRP